MTTNPGESLKQAHERILGVQLNMTDAPQDIAVLGAIADRLEAIEQRLSDLEAVAGE